MGIALVAGTFAAAYGLIPGLVGPGAFAVLGIALAATLRKRPRALALSIGLTVFFGGALYSNARHLGPPGDSLARYAATGPADRLYTLEGRVERPDILLPEGDYMQFILRADSAIAEEQRLALEGGVLVRWSAPGIPLYPGDRVRVTAPLELDIARINPGVRSIEDFYRRRGVHTALRARGPAAVERLAPGPAYSPAYWAARLRGSLALRLVQVVPETTRPFILTVWLGDRRRITDDTYTRFLESGTAHILAVSGIHIAIVFATVAYLLRLMAIPRTRRALLAMGTVLLFAIMAGARISTMRAAIMIVLYLLSDLINREPNPPTALSLAAILFTIHDPDVVLDPGFQLSFLSIASLLIYGDPIHQRLGRLPRGLREGLASTLAVQILPLPVAITLFHVMPIGGIFVNLLIVPLLTAVLWLTFLASAFVYVFEPVALLFGQALHAVASLILFLVDWVSGVDATHAYLTAPTLLALMACWGAAGALLVLLHLTNTRWIWTGALVGSLLLAAISWNPFNPRPEVTFLDVGHGDAAFVRTPGGSTLLIDAGDRTEFIDMGKRVVGPFLWANHVSRLDALIVSHPDRDHIGGAPYILDHFQVGAVWLGPHPTDSPYEQALIEQCARRNIPIQRLAAGDRVRLEGADLSVLHPPADWPRNLSPNEGSLTVRIRWPGASVLFPGDAETLAEAAIAARGSIRAAVLKVPHHASNTSSSAAFIRAVQPSLAVVSVGRRGRRSVLSPAVIDRYGDQGTLVFRTDIVGGVRLSFDGGRVTAHAARTERGYLVRDFP